MPLAFTQFPQVPTHAHLRADTMSAVEKSPVMPPDATPAFDPASRPVFWFAGGGTGGHLYPGLSVASAITRQIPQARCVFLGTTRPIDGSVVPAAGHELVVQPVEPWPGKQLMNWPGFAANLMRSVRICKRRLHSDKPAAVLGLGGYAAAPAMKIAHAAGVPVAMHNPDARPGRANSALAKYARAIFCQFDASRDLFPGHQVITTGCPVRSECLTATREGGIARFGLDPGKKTLLFTGASQGAKNLNDALILMLPELKKFADAWQVVCVSGPGKDGELRRAIHASPVRGGLPVIVIPFTDHMPELLAASDLVVSRAGASSCAEFTALGLASILVPYPYDPTVHQQYNADVLVAAGAAVRVDDAKDAKGNAAALLSATLELMEDGVTREAMAAAAKRLGRADAAQQIANALLKLANVSSHA